MREELETRMRDLELAIQAEHERAERFRAALKQIVDSPRHNWASDLQAMAHDVLWREDGAA